MKPDILIKSVKTEYCTINLMELDPSNHYDDKHFYEINIISANKDGWTSDDYYQYNFLAKDEDKIISTISSVCSRANGVSELIVDDGETGVIVVDFANLEGAQADFDEIVSAILKLEKSYTKSLHDEIEEEAENLYQDFLQLSRPAKEAFIRRVR